MPSYNESRCAVCGKPWRMILKRRSIVRYLCDEHGATTGQRWLDDEKIPFTVSLRNGQTYKVHYE